MNTDPSTYDVLGRRYYLRANFNSDRFPETWAAGTRGGPFFTANAISCESRSANCPMSL